MKKTPSEVEYALRSFLQNSMLFTDPKKPNGLLGFNRLDNSILEDTIISALTLDAKQIQEGLINVNIYVPNLVLKFENNIIDKSQKNAKRIAEINRLAMDTFSDDEIFIDNYNFYYQQSRTYQNTENLNEHLINIRIEFTAVNL